MASVSGIQTRRKKAAGNMDNNNNNNNSKANSRPSSASSAASSKTSTVQNKKEKGPTKDELVKANTELSLEVESLTEQNQHLKGMVTAVIDKLIENSKIKGVKVPQVVLNPNVVEIPPESLVTLTEKLTAESHKSNTLEFRVEELETRITHLNMEIAKLLRTRMTVENGLEDIVNNTENIEDIKVKANELVREIKSSALFTFCESVPPLLPSTPEIREPASTESSLQNRNQMPKIDKQSSTITVLLNSQNLDLTPPLKKLPGDTHIKEMHKELRQYVVQQLSLPKGNGADWRMMGERLGVSADLINQWKRWKLDLPMHFVLYTWSQSPGATVRLLHRHLVSPQMRSTLLAKRISDFYHVD